MTLRRKGAVAVLAVAVLLMAPLAHARARAALRWTPGFAPLDGDRRVWAEKGSEDLARLVALALDDAVGRVESGHGSPFPNEFRVYVCATAESFARRLAVSPDAPVRGMALWRDVWISPRALDFAGRDTHRESLAHELSHLHLNQSLGLWRRSRLPGWLVEGLADHVADTGFEKVGPEQARAAILAGRHIRPTSGGGWRPGDSRSGEGLPWPLRHSQARLFVSYLATNKPAAFRKSMAAVLAGEAPDAALGRCYGRSLAVLWSDFTASLEAS